MSSDAAGEEEDGVRKNNKYLTTKQRMRVITRGFTSAAAWPELFVLILVNNYYQENNKLGQNKTTDQTNRQHITTVSGVQRVCSLLYLPPAFRKL